MAEGKRRNTSGLHARQGDLMQIRIAAKEAQRGRLYAGIIPRGRDPYVLKMLFSRLQKESSKKQKKATRWR